MFDVKLCGEGSDLASPALSLNCVIPLLLRQEKEDSSIHLILAPLFD